MTARWYVAATGDCSASCKTGVGMSARRGGAE